MTQPEYCAGAAGCPIREGMADPLLPSWWRRWNLLGLRPWGTRQAGSLKSLRGVDSPVASSWLQVAMRNPPSTSINVQTVLQCGSEGEAPAGDAGVVAQCLGLGVRARVCDWSRVVVSWLA